MVEPGTAAVFTPDSDLLGPEASLWFVTGCCQSVCVFFFQREHVNIVFGRKDLKLNERKVEPPEEGLTDSIHKYLGAKK